MGLQGESRGVRRKSLNKDPLGRRNVEGASITTAAEMLKASGMRSSREVGNPSTNANLDLPPNPHSPGSHQGEDTVKVLDGRSSLREDGSGGSKKNSLEKVRNGSEKAKEEGGVIAQKSVYEMHAI